MAKQVPMVRNRLCQNQLVNLASWSEMIEDEFEYSVKEDLCCLWGSGSGSGGNKVDHFQEGVDKDNDGIKSGFGAWQLGDEIHGDLFPWLGRDG